MNTKNIELNAEETQAIKFLLGIKKIGYPVSPNFEIPMTLISKGIVAIDASGMPHISNEQEWRLLILGTHPTQNK